MQGMRKRDKILSARNVPYHRIMQGMKKKQKENAMAMIVLKIQNYIKTRFRRNRVYHRIMQGMGRASGSGQGLKGPESFKGKSQQVTWRNRGV